MAITDLVQRKITRPGAKTRYIWESPDTGLEFRWPGVGHTVNVYSGDREVDVLSSGSFANKSATRAEVVAHIRLWLKEGGAGRKKTAVRTSSRRARRAGKR